MPDVLQRYQHYFFLKQPRLLLIFALACALPLVFAIYTQHAWEDYYITFRASRNLATGHGLVFNAGDRLQTFTSPIGTLLPALASFLTGNGSDVAPLWLYRTLCIPAFGLAATLLFATTTRLRYPIFASVALISRSTGWRQRSCCSVFAYAFWAMFGARTRPWLHLGAVGMSDVDAT